MTRCPRGECIPDRGGYCIYCRHELLTEVDDNGTPIEQGEDELAKDTLTKQDMAEFSEIEGHFKAHGETLVSLRKIREGKFHIQLGSGEPFYGHLVRDETRNISDIRRTES